MKRNATVDSIPQLDEFHHLVHGQQDTAQGIQEKLLHSDDTVLAGLWSDTHELLTEITCLVTNAPVELRGHFGDQIFEDMHRDVATAVTVSTSTPLGATGAGWNRKRLVTSVQLAVYILDLLSEDAQPGALLIANENWEREHPCGLLSDARLSASRVEHSKSLYLINTGATRL